VTQQQYDIAEPGLVMLHAALTDVGVKRSNNEDAFGIFPGAGGSLLLVVADGVGGNAAGEVASRLAVEVIGKLYFADGTPADPGAALRQTIGAANARILEAAAADPRRAGMATTTTAAVFNGRQLTLGHVGDCRAYLARSGSIEQLTDDHSLAAEYERRGEPLPPDKRNLANVLTRCLGVGSELAVDIRGPMTLEVDSMIVMCSDGLSKVVSPDEILYAVSMHLPEGACRRLVDLARERGGPDNITVQVARVSAA
jgi:serine/threonine protein phosphatase PrpC